MIIICREKILRLKTFIYKVRKTAGDKVIPEDDFEFMKEEKHSKDNGGAGDCRLELWRCLSGSIEDGVRMFDSRSRMMEVAGSLMTRLAFHGPRQSVWQSVMSLPKVWTKEYHSNKVDIHHIQAREVTRCIRGHEQCTSYTILRRALRTRSQLEE